MINSAEASGEGRGIALIQSTDSRVVLAGSQTFRPDRSCIWPAQCLAPHPALRADLSPRKSGARLRRRFASNLDSTIQTARPLHSRGAMRPRFAISLARPSRGCGAAGGARVQ